MSKHKNFRRKQPKFTRYTTKPKHRPEEEDDEEPEEWEEDDDQDED
jgi:hypothetical protein